MQNKRFSTLSLLTAALAALLLLPALFSCDGVRAPEKKAFTGDGRVRVTATLFPPYDFAVQIGGERVEVVKLLPAGAESHSFEPTSADLGLIGQSDLFFYTGPDMEPWAKTVLDAIGTSSGVTPVDLSAGITALEEEDGKEEEAGHVGHHHGVDPHIWTSPRNAKEMVRTVTDALISADPEGKEYYETRCAAYLASLDTLDERFSVIAAASNGKTLIFGGRFAFRYLANDYGFTCVSPFVGCDAEAEPSSAALAVVIDVAKAQGTSTVFCEEMTEPRVAKTVAEEVGCGVTVLHSCHNVSAEDLAAGVTYLDLMSGNAEIIAGVLNG